MKEKIFGDRIDKDNDMAWIYTGDIGNDILSPVKAIRSEVNGEYINLGYISKSGCDFKIKIGPMKNYQIKSTPKEGEKIAESRDKTITLTITKGNENFSVKDFMNQSGDCFKEKEEKKEKNKSENDSNYGGYSEKKSKPIASPDDFDFIYKNAAFPFKIFSLKTGIKEEVERIKELMK